MKVCVIGNGFSINLVNLLEKHKYIDKGVIDLKNLFSKGDKIPNETFSD